MRRIRVGNPDSAKILAQWAIEGWRVHPPDLRDGFLVYRLTR